MGDARRGLAEYPATPGAAVAGLIALVAGYAQLAGGVVITGVVLGPAAALVIAAAALVARFGERGAQVPRAVRGSLARRHRAAGSLAGARRALRLGSVSCFCLASFPCWPGPGTQAGVCSASRAPRFPGPAAVMPGASAGGGGRARRVRRRRQPGELQTAAWKTGATGRRTGEPGAARDGAAREAG
jgi:hypothetical protein